MKTIRTILIFALTLSLTMTLVGCKSTPNDERGAPFEYSYDASKMPPNTRNIAFLSGAPREMGIQYGKQEKDSFQRWAAYTKSAAIAKLGTIEKAYEEVRKYEEIYKEEIPDVLEIWKGISEGSGIPYEDVLIAATVFVKPAKQECSTISMWGDATKDGEIITGANRDLSLEPQVYEPTVVAFPKNGNSFIAASGLIGNSYMNSAGLVVMGSLGQSNLPEDVDRGVGLKVACLAAIMNCETAEEAEKYLTQKLVPANYGTNFHVIDASGNARIIEITADRYVVRKSGDFKENNYIIATNGFLTKEMQKSLYTGDDMWDDCMPRYWTEEKVITDNFGENTVDTLNNALKQTGYYVNGEYVDDVWNLDEYKGFWLPENREPGTKCQVRTIAKPAEGIMYLMAGGSETLSNSIPDGTGNFCKIHLGENHKEMLAKAKKYAQIQIFLGARDISRSDGSIAREEYLNEAKRALYEGLNYESLAGCATDSDESLALYSKSMSAYCKAHCYAQLAQNDPDKLQREGEDYEI